MLGFHGAELFDSKDYLLDVSRCIHLNPVEAKMVKSPCDYRWSSNTDYISVSVKPHITTTRGSSQFYLLEKILIIPSSETIITRQW